MTNCRAKFRRASLDPAFAQENWGFLALQDFAAKARYPPEDTPLSGSREQLLARIRQLRAELEGRLGAG
jgi:hypothetical protein